MANRTISLLQSHFHVRCLVTSIFVKYYCYYFIIIFIILKEIIVKMIALLYPYLPLNYLFVSFSRYPAPTGHMHILPEHYKLLVHQQL